MGGLLLVIHRGVRIDGEALAQSTALCKRSVAQACSINFILLQCITVRCHYEGSAICPTSATATSHLP